MRKCALCFILAGIRLPTFAANRVTVEQVEQVLSSAIAEPSAPWYYSCTCGLFRKSGRGPGLKAPLICSLSGGFN
jgi:hypothetical protein